MNLKTKAVTTFAVLIAFFTLSTALSTSVIAEPLSKVRLDTNMGAMVIELNQAKAPISVKNFLEYVNEGFYNGTVFHRVIDGFMIQGGGFGKDMRKKATRPPIKNEANNGLKNVRGTVAMARTGVVDSATAQFFINVTDNAFLDFKTPTTQGFGYAVFGRIVEGMDVMDKIKKLPTHAQGPQANVPTPQVVITNAVVVVAP